MVADRTYFLTLDGIRGIAAILILLRHAEFIFEPFVFQESYLAVDLFFVLSGVVICQAYGDALKRGGGAFWLISTRIIRIYPCYILGSAIGLFNMIVSSKGYAGGGHTLYDIVIYSILAIFVIPNPGIGTPAIFPLDGPAWSLFFELVANMVFFIIYVAVPTRIVKAMLGMFACILALLIFTSPDRNISSGTIFSEVHFGIIRVGYSFFIGTLIYERYKSINAKQIDNILSTYAPYLIILIVAAILVYSPSVVLRPYFDLITVTCVFPIIVYIGLFYQPAGIGAKIFKFIGVISYPLYVLHAPFVTLLYGGVKKIFGVAVADYAPFSGIIFILVLMPCCFYVVKYYDAPLRHILIAGRVPGNSQKSRVVES